jgi:hypothetical protein
MLGFPVGRGIEEEEEEEEEEEWGMCGCVINDPTIKIIQNICPKNTWY